MEFKSNRSKTWLEDENGRQIALLDHPEVRPGVVNLMHTEVDPSLEGKPVTITFSVPATRLASMTKGVEGDEGAITAAPYLDPDKLYLVVCGTSQSIKYIRKAEMNCDSNGDPILFLPGTPYISVLSREAGLLAEDRARQNSP